MPDLRRLFRNRAAPAPALQRGQGAWLLATALVTLAPHMLTLPTWASGLCLLLLAWRGLLLWQGRVAPQRALLIVLAIAVVFGVRAEFGRFFGLEPGIVVLSLMLCLKLLEARAMRDIRAAVLLCLFLLLGQFFDNQTLPIALVTLAGTVLAMCSLLALSDPQARAGARLRTGAVLVAQGLPFMVVVFVLFPRLPGPLWALPTDAHSARTGLSDTMTPGSISNLGQSDEIAFRAEFDGPPPPRAQRYWRGPVLGEFDGSTWRMSPPTVRDTAPYPARGGRLDYRLTLEAHDRHWLLALDYVAPDLPGVRYTADFQALAQRRVRERMRFELAAYPDAVVGVTEPPQALEAALQLPADGNPRARALAAQLAAGAPDPGAVLARTLRHLQDARLIYTLRPPLLGRDSVDGFLFDTGRGFCEHFASAFVFLMRAAGVPARVVTGYQGGEINPVDGSVVVRQSDAHAWAEVWLAGRGWVRIDPTALAAPARIENGLASALPAGEPLPFMLRTDLAWLITLRHRWEAVSNAWNQVVLGYSADQQRELLSRLGLERAGWSMLAGFIAVLGAALLAVLMVWAVRTRSQADALDRAWAAFSDRLARHGLARAAAEGPLDYGRRLATHMPRHGGKLADIAATYARLRYGPTPDQKAIRSLTQRIRHLDLT